MRSNTRIGNVILPYALNAPKGSKSMTMVDAKTYQVVRSWSLPYGIRPHLLTRDGKRLYTQLSQVLAEVLRKLQSTGG
jgi:hypothetical protein